MPRLATQAVLWPVIATTSVVERHQVLEWTRALLTSDDGLVGVRPELQYATGFLPSAGARFFHRRLPGPGSELMASFRTAGPAVLVGEAGWRGPEWSGLALRGTWSRRSSMEYRWYISSDLDATLFVDVGTVAGARFSGLDRSRWFPSYGLGFRFYSAGTAYWEARPLAGLQIAYVPEGNLRLLLSLAAF